MKIVVLISYLVALAASAPTPLEPVRSPLDRFVIKHITPEGSHVQRGDPGRSVIGYYVFYDSEGKPHRIDYIADEYGFRVLPAELVVPDPVPEHQHVHQQHEVIEQHQTKPLVVAPLVKPVPVVPTVTEAAEIDLVTEPMAIAQAENFEAKPESLVDHHKPAVAAEPVADMKPELEQIQQSLGAEPVAEAHPAALPAQPALELVAEPVAEAQPAALPAQPILESVAAPVVEIQAQPIEQSVAEPIAEVQQQPAETPNAPDQQSAGETPNDPSASVDSKVPEPNEDQLKEAVVIESQSSSSADQSKLQEIDLEATIVDAEFVNDPKPVDIPAAVPVDTAVNAPGEAPLDEPTQADSDTPAQLVLIVAKEPSINKPAPSLLSDYQSALLRLPVSVPHPGLAYYQGSLPYVRPAYRYPPYSPYGSYGHRYSYGYPYMPHNSFY